MRCAGRPKQLYKDLQDALHALADLGWTLLQLHVSASGCLQGLALQIRVAKPQCGDCRSSGPMCATCATGTRRTS